MRRVVVPKLVIDRLIRDKVAEVAPCDGVNALPVVVRRVPNGGCNWTVPGWIGATESVRRCESRMSAYIRLLASQFDIAEDR